MITTQLDNSLPLNVINMRPPEVELLPSNITQECLQAPWLPQMIDSMSELPRGSAILKFADLGDFEQCLSIGKYCLGQVSVTNSTVPSPVWAFCLPTQCSTADANLAGNAVLNKLLPNKEIRVSFTDLLCQQRDEESLSPGAIAAIIFLGLLAIVVLFYTCWDLSSRTCPDVARAFSLYTNSKNVFRINKTDHLSCVNGLRCLSIMWIIVYDQYLAPKSGFIVNTNYLAHWSKNLYTMFLTSGGVGIDTLLTLDGTLISYFFMKSRHKNIRFHCVQYYLHKYLRLTVPLVMVVLVSATLLNYLGSGPKWPLFTLYFQNNCKENWWSTLLYVQNYVNPTKMCVGQTWYTDIDMQLYLISPLVLFALWKYPMYGLPVLSLFCLGSMGAGFYETWSRDLPAITFDIDSTHSTDFQKYYFLVTHTRATPWIIGTVLGYFLFKIKHRRNEFVMNGYVLGCSWIICLVVLFACVLGGEGLVDQESKSLRNSLYSALVRPFWSLAITWIILACTCNYGGLINTVLSLPVFQVLNRFIYSMYLTHLTLLFGIAYGKHYPDYFSEFNRAYEYWGTFCFSFGLSVLLVLFAEAPAMALEKLMFAKIFKFK